MTFEKSVSFRTHLLTHTTDLTAKVGLHCTRTNKLIANMVSLLASYTEEEIPLNPSVFICNSIAELVRRAGIGEHVPLSECEPTETSAPKILKLAAPLCSRNWRIYVERSASGERCSYGVFAGSTDPAALAIDESLLYDLDPGFPVVRIAQSATNKVEVRTSAGEAIEFRFNDDLDVLDLDGSTQIGKLASVISGGAGTGNPKFEGLVKRLLGAAVKESHGTLIAVVSGATLPNALSDSIKLQPALDLYERYVAHQAEGFTSSSVSRLQAAAELVTGFIKSDGITVFSTDGKVMAYRAFIASESPSPPGSGGARTRAYMVMAGLIGTELRAAFLRSQDGRTEIALAIEGEAHV